MSSDLCANGDGYAVGFNSKLCPSCVMEGLNAPFDDEWWEVDNEWLAGGQYR